MSETGIEFQEDVAERAKAEQRVKDRFKEFTQAVLDARELGINYAAYVPVATKGFVLMKMDAE